LCTNAARLCTQQDRTGQDDQYIFFHVK
jgi:hypothetical protein